MSSSSTTRQPGTARSMWLWLALCSCAAAAAAGFWYWQRGGFHLDATPSPASLPEPPAESPAAKGAGAGERSGSKHQDELAQPPVLEFESLPEQVEHDAGAEPSSEAESDSTESLGTPPQRGRRHRRGAPRGAGEKAEVAAAGNKSLDDKARGKRENGKEEAASETNSDKAEEKPGDTPAHAPQPPGKADCDPPWYIDAKGIQRLKPKCL